MTPAGVAAAVAEYVYGAQHAFIARSLYGNSVRVFTAHAAAMSISSSRVDLVHFILVDLVSIGLLSHHGGVYSLVPLAKVYKAIEAVPDGHLLHGILE